MGYFCNRSLCSDRFPFALLAFPILRYSSSAELSVLPCKEIVQSKGNGCKKFALNLKLLYATRPRSRNTPHCKNNLYKNIFQSEGDSCSEFSCSGRRLSISNCSFTAFNALSNFLLQSPTFCIEITSNESYSTES